MPIELPHDPPPPPPPPVPADKEPTRAESIKLIGGLVVVCVGVTALALITIIAIEAVRGSDAQVVSVATASFSVIGTVVGAYFGLKIGADGTTNAIKGMRDEAAKAQAFAAYVPTESAKAAIAEAAALAPNQPPAIPPVTPVDPVAPADGHGGPQAGP